ncbi:hypothetical protein [Nonomuraea dietziae]
MHRGTPLGPSGSPPAAKSVKDIASASRVIVEGSTRPAHPWS